MSVLFFESWRRHYERAQARRLVNLPWFCQSTDLSHPLFVQVAVHPSGLEIYGLFRILLAVAARCTPRGILAMRSGDPLDVVMLGQMTHVAQARIRKVLPLVESFGLIQRAESVAAAVERMASDDRTHSRSERTSDADSERSTEGVSRRRSHRFYDTEERRGEEKNSSSSSSSSPSGKEPPVFPPPTADEFADDGRRAVCRALRAAGVPIDLAESLSTVPSVRLCMVEHLAADRAASRRTIAPAAWFVAGLRRLGALPPDWRAA